LPGEILEIINTNFEFSFASNFGARCEFSFAAVRNSVLLQIVNQFCDIHQSNFTSVQLLNIEKFAFYDSKRFELHKYVLLLCV
jgi:hypothetical protein